MNCRLCLTECTNENAFLLFDGKRKNKWKQIIFQYLAIKIDRNDDYSTAICGECFRHLNDFDSFYKFIKERQLELQNMRSTGDLEKTQHNLLSLHIKTETFEEETFTEITCATNAKEDLKIENFSLAKSELLNETEKTTTNVVVQNEAMQNIEPVGNEAVLETADYKPNLNSNDNDEDRTCIICNKMHKSFKALQSHMYKIHNDIKPFTCNRCGLQFRFRPNFRQHLQDLKCANRGKVAREDIERRTCFICRKVHQSFQGLQSHIYRFHSGERPFTCDKCGFGFRFEYSLRRHQNKGQCGKSSTHLASKAYDRDEDRTCGICHRRFKNVDALSSHMYISHKGAKPFACKTCGLEFRLRGTFLRHFWKCSGSPFEENTQTAKTNADSEKTESLEHRSCVLCLRVFDDISSLYMHMTKKHENTKPFNCQACGKCFVLKRALEKHNERNCCK